MKNTRSDVLRSRRVATWAVWAFALLLGGCVLDAADPDGATTAGEDSAAEATGVVEQGLAEATCGHSICETGAAVSETCDSCVQSICDVDSFCCTTAWDSICVNEVSTICGRGPVAVSSSTLVSKLKLRITTGADDLRAGSQAYGSFQTASGMLPKSSLNGGVGFPGGSVRTATIPISPSRTLGSLTGFQLEWDGAPRNFPDTYDNWDVSQIRFMHEPAGRCPTFVGASISPGRMTGSRTIFFTPMTFP